MRKLFAASAVVLAVAAGSGCTGDAAHRAAAATMTCTPTSINADGTLPGGSVDGTSVSALAERSSSGPVRVGEQVKFILRMAGNGDLAVSAIDPDGREWDPDWGPEAHGSSNFGGAGDEWGFGVTFPVAGCWTIELRRTESGTGYLQLEVT
ncbi:MAG: hypothetical protein AAGC49_15635 [Brevundimonas sp.]